MKLTLFSGNSAGSDFGCDLWQHTQVLETGGRREDRIGHILLDPMDNSSKQTGSYNSKRKKYVNLGDQYVVDNTIGDSLTETAWR